jgi:N-succinyldiaminopimelate aminotransferase
VLITAGASEAIAAAILALVEPGDEVVLFEPYFDHYATSVALAGGRRRVVRLREPDLSFDVADLESAIGPHTRLILLNTPHNPTGKVFDAEELGHVARLAIRHDLLVVTDEVYEHLVYDGGRHIPMATLPGMAERTLTISSGGKSFGFTGWKIGWAHGPADMVSAVLTAKQSLTYVSGGPFQHAMVTALGLDDGYFSQLADDLEGKRDLLGDGLRAAGFEVFPTAGTYFVTADIRPLGFDDGVAFCMSMPERCGVVAVPSAVFYDDGEAGRHLIRFAFCKQPEILVEASRRLAGMAGSGS